MAKDNQPAKDILNRMGVDRRNMFAAAAAGTALTMAAAAPAVAQQRAQYRFRMQCFLGPGTIEWDRLVPRFVQRVNAMSGGRIQITPYPPAALVPSFDMLDAVGRRVIDMAYGAQLWWRGRFPFTQWTWGIPFAFDKIEQYDYLWYEAGMTDLVREAFATIGVQFLGPVYSDDWGSTISRRPIRRLDDFRGMKVRSGGIAAEIWKSFGASVVLMPGEEMYTAMSTGVIDAANWGSPYGMLAAKLHEVAKFYTGPSLIHSDMEDMFMNKAAFDALPRDLQDVMTMAVRVYGVERYTFAVGESARAFDTLRRANVEIITLPPEDVQRIKAMTDELLPRLAGNDDYSRRVLKIVAETKELLGKRPANF